MLDVVSPPPGGREAVFVTSEPRASARLENGARIAVVGGGPAGSAFALFANHYAREAGLELQVTVFEPRDFSRLGPRGCNMCAGLVPSRALRPLGDLDVVVPPSVIRQQITQYTLHTAAGRIALAQPDPEADVISVYRGSGPLGSPVEREQRSFDGFLLERARSCGTEIVAERVTSVGFEGGPRVRTDSRTFEVDLVVLASGINRSTVSFDDFGYVPPPRRQMAQCEICLGEDGVRSALGGSVHIVLAPEGRLSFGALIPKGRCINVSLLGDDLPAGSMDAFLALPEVAALLPHVVARACACRPRIAIGPAEPLYADRFVAIGDAGVSHLYKNGIGSAIHAARQAAYAAVHHGIDAASFRSHYAPLCRDILRDNRAGRFLFRFSRIFRASGVLARPHLHSVAAEQSLPPAQRLHSRLLWGMFSGAYPYRQLLAMAARPAVQWRLLRGAVRGPWASPATVRPGERARGGAGDTTPGGVGRAAGQERRSAGGEAAEGGPEPSRSARRRRPGPRP